MKAPSTHSLFSSSHRYTVDLKKIQYLKTQCLLLSQCNQEEHDNILLAACKNILKHIEIVLPFFRMECVLDQNICQAIFPILVDYTSQINVAVHKEDIKDAIQTDEKLFNHLSDSLDSCAWSIKSAFYKNFSLYTDKKLSEAKAIKMTLMTTKPIPSSAIPTSPLTVPYKK